MATPIPVEQYPLLHAGGGRPQLIATVDIMNDGTPRPRTLATTTYRNIELEFAPLRRDESNGLSDFITNNAGVLVSVTWQGRTFQGYFTEEPSEELKDGLWWVTATLYASEVVG